MKAITIHQPWASLIAIGAKGFETRDWNTNYRGEISIHAGKKVDWDAVERLYGDLLDLGIDNNMPTGVIVATAELSACYPINIDFEGNAALMLRNGPVWYVGKGSQEYRFGHYANGRYAWELCNVKILDTTIPAKGQQGLWNWDGEIG